MAPEERDHIDRFLDGLEPIEGLDYEVEGIIDRIGGINRRIKRGHEATLKEFGISYPDWHVMTTLRNSGPRKAGVLARYLEVSTGAMTSRLDNLEKEGLIRRLADPDDRRSVIVELTDAGRDKWHAAASVQARKEAFFTRALTEPDKKKLNALLRKLMLAFEEAEAEAEDA
ncbi:MAG TPA: MarR family transcriptional regulator [Gaiellaceae bacterium]|nr:MarR family transcriptional regulator [Gaiellaceae bacterium]